MCSLRGTLAIFPGSGVAWVPVAQAGRNVGCNLWDLEPEGTRERSWRLPGAGLHTSAWDAQTQKALIGMISGRCSLSGDYSHRFLPPRAPQTEAGAAEALSRAGEEQGRGGAAAGSSHGTASSSSSSVYFLVTASRLYFLLTASSVSRAASPAAAAG